MKIRTRSGSNGEVISEIIVASATFDGEYFESLDYVDNYEANGYEQVQESTTQSDGSLNASIAYSGDVETADVDFSDNLVSSFTSVGSGSAADHAFGTIGK